MPERGRRADFCRHITALALLVAIFVAGSLRFAWSQGVAESLRSDRSIALVIGNGRFDGPLALTQPAADAVAVAARLRSRGFKLVTSSGASCGEDQPLTNLDRSAMRAAIACFARAAENARQAFFYFSGHTIIVDRRNYLVPAGAALAPNPSSGDLVELASVLEMLEQANAGLSIVVLDAARGEIREFAGNSAGLDRVAATARPRIVAYSAPVGAWTEDSSTDRRSRRARSAESAGGKPNSEATGADSPLSPYTRRLVRALDDDLDLRSLDQPGLSASAIFVSVSDLSGRPGGERAAEVTIENVVTTEMLGRLPRIGRATCELLNWRAENVGNCIEIAAAYENCGKDAAMRQRLQKACPADHETLVRYALQASLASVMKTKSCAGFREFIAKFETEPATAELKEFKEIRSLAQYTCALEAKAQIKSRFDTVMSARDCAQTHRLLAEGRELIEVDMRGRLEKLSKEVCCPEYVLGKDCLTRKVLASRVIAVLEKKGCVIGKTAEAKTARAVGIVATINASNPLKVDLAVSGAPLDQIWSRVEALKKEDCLCQKPAAGACVSEAPPSASLPQVVGPAPPSAISLVPAPLPTAPAPPVPTAPKQLTVVAPPPVTAGPSAALANFLITDNRDIHGQDIPLPDGTVGIAGANIGACADECQSNQSCVAVSYDRWKNRCYLKQSLAPPLLNARSTIAVKKPSLLPGASTAKIDMQIVRNVRFESDNVRRRRAADFNACRAVCSDDTRCVAFNFLKNVRNADNCEIFPLTNGFVRDVAADGGFKHQQP